MRCNFKEIRYGTGQKGDCFDTTRNRALRKVKGNALSATEIEQCGRREDVSANIACDASVYFV